MTVKIILKSGISGWLTGILLFFVLNLFSFQNINAQNPKQQEKEDMNETLPEFPGGIEAMYNYMIRNLNYPQEDLDKKVSGLVVVLSTIEEDGSISNVKIFSSNLRSRKKDSERAKNLCEEEALRVVRNMPVFKPATKDGKPVEVECRFPIRFSI